MVIPAQLLTVGPLLTRSLAKEGAAVISPLRINVIIIQVSSAACHKFDDKPTKTYSFNV